MLYNYTICVVSVFATSPDRFTFQPSCPMQMLLEHEIWYLTELDLIHIGSIPPNYLWQIMSQNTIIRVWDGVEYLQRHLILFFCAL